MAANENQATGIVIGNGYGAVGPSAPPASGEYPPPPAYGDKPPDYQECTDPQAAAPPSYESLYGEFRAVRSPGGFMTFARRIIGVIVGTVIAAVFIAIVSMIPIAMIVVGAMNLHKCPIQPYLPIYLIVGGSVGLLKSLTNFVYRLKAERAGNVDPEDRVNPNPFDGLLNCFMLAWFITGSVWVYRLREPDMLNPGRSDYCDPTTYWFTLTLISLAYVMGLMFLFLMCCCGCVALCCGPGTSPAPH